MHFNVPNYPMNLIRTDIKTVNNEKQVEDRAKRGLLAMKKKEEDLRVKRMNKKPACSQLGQQNNKLKEENNKLTVLKSIKRRR